MTKASTTKAPTSKSWQSKWGWRSVRVELPTLEEALEAAAGLTSDTRQQIQLAADLLQVPLSEVHVSAERIIKNRAGRALERPSIRSRSPVVVERRSRRHAITATAHRRSA